MTDETITQATSETTPADSAETTEHPLELTQENVDRIIRHHVYAAMGFGLIPLPIVDFISVAAVQVNLVAELAKIYGVDYSQERIRSVVIAMAGAAVPATLSSSLASAVKIIPIIGQSLGAVSMPIISGASTYAVGEIFNQHFASGGTFLSFDVEQAKEKYSELVSKGKEFAQNLRTKQEDAPSPTPATEETTAQAPSTEPPKA